MSVQQRVLLIAQEAEIANDLADTLEALGYEVADILTSPKPPLENDYDVEADVVLLDLHVKDTADPVAIGRQIAERRNWPVVYLADDLREADQVSRDGDGALFVMWPFPSAVLDTAIQETLNRKAPWDGYFVPSYGVGLYP